MIQSCQIAVADALNISMIEAIFAAKAEKLNSQPRLRIKLDSGRFCSILNYLTDKWSEIKSILNRIRQSSLWIGHYDSNSIPKNPISQIEDLTCFLSGVNGGVKTLIRSILNNPRTGLTGTPQGYSKFNQINVLASQC